ncbi:hypothetical protein [Agromyces sp. LHK192]|uniref:hypothetical protein n=1 Tax=Agromyces sp. LHK192 TaxID=2498704 RepID=UPI000FD74DBE|nr:hypothetical protein [Agromyces sp. LHK192]
MESDSGDRSDAAAHARTALKAIGDDRSRIGELMTAETRWAAPAQGAGAALLVAAPAAGLQWAWLLFVASTSVFIGVELLFRRRSGLSVTRPAGPNGLALLIALALLLLGSLGASLALAVLGLDGWVLVVAAGAGIVFALGTVAYDRVYAAEVLRAG